MALPTNIGASYPDRSAGDVAHQGHHDVIHETVNRIPDDGAPVLTETTGNAAYQPLAEYTVAVIPDTQYLPESWPAHFQSLANYLTTNATALNLQLIVHVGDVVNKGNTTQFGVAATPMGDLFNSGIPFITAIGNHDYDAAFDPNPPTSHDATTLWNTYFGVDKYNTKDWYGGVVTAGESENMYIDVTLGGRPTIVFSLEWGPRTAVLDWADGIVAANPNHDIIVVTHSYLYIDGERETSATTNAAYFTGANNADTMWSSYFSSWSNLVAVFGGHHLGGNIAFREDVGDNGNAVAQQFYNWQEEFEGGQGRVVLFTINPVTGSVRRRVYNPATAAFETTAGYEKVFRTAPAPKEGLDRLYLTAAEGDVRYEPAGVVTPPVERALYFPNVSGNHVSCPSAASLNVDDFDIRLRLTMPSWTHSNSSGHMFLMGKWDTATTKQYLVSLLSTGRLQALTSTDGSTTTSAPQSTVVLPFSAGSQGWVRATRNSTTGDISYWYSSDDTADSSLVTWTQLGTTVASTAGALFAGTGALVVGDLAYAANWSMRGAVHRAQVYNGASAVADARFEAPVHPRYRDDLANVWSYTGSDYAWVDAS